ncbi:ATP-binding cassette domain-containing protein [Leucobacter luti]|uniref:Ribose transport system ATP-binding protein/rhamnose transport system ATP-binding protein n=1 Tax=Leucobacter luti TaxID=340320 RepID=A0A4Q7U7L5_9MICO|nr:sugar ABC transporter ATP-binding protein [Leucobacter luti]MBL3700623.1 sugar ABC transporter ATP-binding protein [Leucobacter luti]RZT68538.1 ribose transport system ATP-binding protein/rhamnose transport system ATP-binding protein [Leucobacter luti]
MTQSAADPGAAVPGAPPRDATRLEYSGVTVEFGATRALDDVSFAAAPGEIIGLLGHNGAGKSTLCNVTTGVIQATSGAFSVDGVPVARRLTPREAAQLGITVIHQEPALAPNMTVLENLFLARQAPPAKDRRRLASEALATVGAQLPLEMPVEALGLGERQLVDLARGLLAGEMKVLLLDEPTAALGKAETEALHALIRSFAARGVTVLYVSHRLPDILEVCTRIVVLRGGGLVVDGPTTDFTPERLAEALVPDLRSLDFTHTEPGRPIMELPAGDELADELVVRAGEVVGLFGMAGGEQFAIAAGLAGAAHPRSYRLDGAEVRFSSPGQAIRRDVFFVPPDRDTEGLVGSETALDNVMLPWYGETGARGWWVSAASGAATYERARAALDIRGPGPDAEVSQFSGGNRQKHLLARWLYPALPKLLILAQPTQGVDVGAKLDIVEAVRDAAAAGAAVLVASSESDEIASMCDRAVTVLGDRLTSVPRSQNFNADLLASLLSAAEPARA